MFANAGLLNWSRGAARVPEGTYVIDKVFEGGKALNVLTFNGRPIGPSYKNDLSEEDLKSYASRHYGEIVGKARVVRDELTSVKKEDVSAFLPAAKPVTQPFIGPPAPASAAAMTDLSPKKSFYQTYQWPIFGLLSAGVLSYILYQQMQGRKKLVVA